MGSGLIFTKSIPWRAIIAYLLSYVLLDWVSFIYPLGLAGITVWNPPPALSLALLVTLGLRYAWLLFPAAWLAEGLVRGSGTSWQTQFSGAAIVAAGYGVSAWILSGWLGFDSRMRRQRDLFALVAVAVVGACVVGALFVALHVYVGTVPSDRYVASWRRFVVGDVIGIISLAPVLMVLAHRPVRAALTAALHKPETVFQVISVMLVLWIVFGAGVTDQFKYFYLLFIPVAWIAARHGLPGAACAVLGVEAGMIVAVEIWRHPPATVIDMQILMAALAVAGLFLGVIVDEREQAMEDLRRSLKLAAASEMAGALAHELNQPLTAIANYSRVCELALSSGRGDVLGTVNKLAAEASRAGRIVRRLRDFLRDGVTQLTAMSVNVLLRGAAARARERTEHESIDVLVDVVDTLPDVLVDRLEIEIVLRNLIDNAVDAIVSANAAQRRINVSASAGPHGFVTVSVRDSGEGVRSDMIERLFEPFTTSKASGMGLGLAISRSIVEAHGGRLWAEHGKCGVFHMTLPMVTNDASDE